MNCQVCNDTKHVIYTCQVSGATWKTRCEYCKNDTLDKLLGFVSKCANASSAYHAQYDAKQLLKEIGK